MKTWIVTFGSSHEHPLTGESLRDCYVRVPAETYRGAHDLMFASVFGRKWAFVYEYADYDDIPDGTLKEPGRAAGVESWPLREVPWIPPSNVARYLVACHEALDASGLTSDRWVDLVVQPAEILAQRVLAATECGATEHANSGRCVRPVGHAGRTGPVPPGYQSTWLQGHYFDYPEVANHA